MYRSYGTTRDKLAVKIKLVLSQLFMTVTPRLQFRPMRKKPKSQCCKLTVAQILFHGYDFSRTSVHRSERQPCNALSERHNMLQGDLGAYGLPGRSFFFTTDVSPVSRIRKTENHIGAKNVMPVQRVTSIILLAK